MRAFQSLHHTPQATTNVYEQQYQMAQFLNEYYLGKVVAANDIGAITYYADIHLLDLYGLGSLETAQVRLEKKFDGKWIFEQAAQKQAVIAIIYDDMFSAYDDLGQGWDRVERWRIDSNFVCYDDTISIYAISPDQKEMLTQNLDIFSRQLPSSVQVLRTGIGE